MDNNKERQLYQLHKKGYEDIQKAITEPKKVQIEGAELVTIKGKQGEPGYTPKKGKDYFTKDEQKAFVDDIMSKIKIPMPKDGEDGKDAEPVDYSNIEKFVKKEVAKIKLPEVKEPTPIDVNSIIASVLEKIPKQKDIFIDYPEIEKYCTKEIERISSDYAGRYRQLNSGGPTTMLGEMANVRVDGVENGQVLMYENGVWKPGTGTGGGGAVVSVNSQTGVVVLDTDDIADTATNRYTNDTDITRLVNTSGTNTGDVSVTDSAEIDFTLTGQDITASLKTGSIDETKLDASLNTSLDLADSSVQGVESVSATGLRIEDGVSGTGDARIRRIVNTADIEASLDSDGAIELNLGSTTLDSRVPYTGATTNLNLGANNLIVDTNTFFVDATSNNVGIGTATPSARLHAISTTEQLRVGYDASNYWNATTGATGITTFNAVGADAGFLFSDSVEVNDFISSVRNVADDNGQIFLQNNNVAGLSGIDFYDNASVLKAGFGYGNASHSIYPDTVFFDSIDTAPIYFGVDGAIRLKVTNTGILAGAGTINASARFEVASTTQGFLPPRMTTTQKNAIASPTAGLVVYDTTLNKLCVYTTAWETITSV